MDNNIKSIRDLEQFVESKISFKDLNLTSGNTIKYEIENLYSIEGLALLQKINNTQFSKKIINLIIIDKVNQKYTNSSHLTISNIHRELCKLKNDFIANIQDAKIILLTNSDERKIAEIFQQDSHFYISKIAYPFYIGEVEHPLYITDNDANLTSFSIFYHNDINKTFMTIDIYQRNNSQQFVIMHSSVDDINYSLPPESEENSSQILAGDLGTIFDQVGLDF